MKSKFKTVVRINTSIDGKNWIILNECRTLEESVTFMDLNTTPYTKLSIQIVKLPLKSKKIECPNCLKKHTESSIFCSDTCFLEMAAQEGE